MAFWDSWFKPKCGGCGARIVDHEPIAHEGSTLCVTCHDAALEEQARRRAEVEARRLAEEEARARFEDRKQFGSDPRTQ